MAPSDRKLRACCYSRVSTTDQNAQIQVEELRRYSAARGWEITSELVDEGYSGGSDARPGLKQLLALARSRRIDVIVVLKLDRMFRSMRGMVVLLQELAELGVQFVSIKEQVDLTTSAGRLLGNLISSFAEFERDIIRERTLMGLAHARKIGKTLGRPKRINDAAIKGLRAQGLSWSQIQKRLGVSAGAVGRALATPKLCTESPSAGDGNSGGYDA
ncbi:recombinase family protein [Bdellovibrionota bacterium FG-1]